MSPFGDQTDQETLWARNLSSRTWSKEENEVTRNPSITHSVVLIGIASLALVLVPAATAGKPGGGGGCAAAAPTVSVENTWGWGAWGSWGMPGQQLGYQIHLVNNDTGCGSSTFLVNVAAPGGFFVSLPTSTVTLKSWSSTYLWAYITSPSLAADGDYPLTATAQRAGTSSPTVSFASSYKVYSTDTVAPTLFWPNPADGQTISGTSYNVVVSSNDDHEVKQIDIYIDNVYRSTTLCDDVSYNCSAAYKWSLRGISGKHTATFKSHDWTGNVAVMNVSFSVS